MASRDQLISSQIHIAWHWEAKKKGWLWCLASGLFLFDLHTLKIRNSGCKKSCDSVFGLQVIGYSCSRHCFHASKLKPPPACERSLNFHCWTAFQTLMARQPMVRKSTRKVGEYQSLPVKSSEIAWNYCRSTRLWRWLMGFRTLNNFVCCRSAFTVHTTETYTQPALGWRSSCLTVVYHWRLSLRKNWLQPQLIWQFDRHFTSLKKLSHMKM